jgi:hypothetical protein
MMDEFGLEETDAEEGWMRWILLLLGALPNFRFLTTFGYLRLSLSNVFIFAIPSMPKVSCVVVIC